MNALRRTATFVWPYRWVAVLMLVTTVLPVAMELIVPRALRTVIDQGIAPGDMAVVWRGSGIMLASAVVGAIATLGQGVCRARLSQGLAFDLRNRLFAHIQSFSFANLDRHADRPADDPAVQRCRSRAHVRQRRYLALAAGAVS